VLAFALTLLPVTLLPAMGLGLPGWWPVAGSVAAALGAYALALLAVVLGGTLIQHIPDEAPSAIAHEQPNPRTEPGHAVHVEPGTLLARVTGAARMAVNSAHHQAVRAVPAGVVVNARAPDGLVEGIESTRHRWALGVQWHPEYAVDPADPLILRAFVEACRG